MGCYIIILYLTLPRLHVCYTSMLLGVRTIKFYSTKSILINDSLKIIAVAILTLE